jgi:diaminopimelate decarboxylase
VNHFEARDGVLHAEGVSLVALADAVGTPTYVYSRATFERHLRVVDEALAPLDHVVCFSVKACSNLAILAMLGRLGAGADVVSGGELTRALQAGISPDRIVFSGVGKSDAELEAAIRAGIYAINAESVEEVDAIGAITARIGRDAHVCLRINPDVDAKTHPYISTGLRENKFGIPFEEALTVYQRAASHERLRIRGVACHIGSQLTHLEPLEIAARQMLQLVDELTSRGITLECLDMGGGLGIPYAAEAPPLPAEYGAMLIRLIGARPLRLIVEPGRVIAGNAGLLLTRVLRTKEGSERRFVVVDAAMNDLVRPALYQSWHALEPVVPRDGNPRAVDVVGPICESADAFARQRELPPLESGDLLVLRSAGAYGFTMASNYNSRVRAAEVLVDGERWALVRERERIEDLLRPEHVPEWLR